MPWGTTKAATDNPARKSGCTSTQAVKETLAKCCHPDANDHVTAARCGAHSIPKVRLPMLLRRLQDETYNEVFPDLVLLQHSNQWEDRPQPVHPGVGRLGSAPAAERDQIQWQVIELSMLADTDSFRFCCLLNKLCSTNKFLSL